VIARFQDYLRGRMQDDEHPNGIITTGLNQAVQKLIPTNSQNVQKSARQGKASVFDQEQIELLAANREGYLIVES
jgi:hypothetical protein